MAFPMGNYSIETSEPKKEDVSIDTKDSNQASGGFRSSINNYFALGGSTLSASQAAGGGSTWQTWLAVAAGLATLFLFFKRRGH